MDSRQLKLLARQAVQLNLNYYGAILDLTRDYLQTIGKVAAAADLGGKPMSAADLGGRPPTAAGPAGGRAPAGSDAGAAGRAAPATPPLVLAARAGATAEAGVMVVNNLARGVTAAVTVTPDLAAAGVRAEPATLALAPGEEATFRLIATPSPAQTADIRGAVSVPGLASRDVQVVLRRLPEPAPAPGHEPGAEPTAAPDAAPAAPDAAADITPGTTLSAAPVAAAGARPRSGPLAAPSAGASSKPGRGG